MLFLKEVFFMTLSEKIKEHRNRLGFSQEKLAELVGVSRQSVTKWEADQSMPCMENLMTLADIFGISISELAGKTEKELLNIRAVKSSWRTYGKITSILGALLLAAAAIIWFSSEKAEADVWGRVLGINGAVWLTLGIIFWLFYKYQRDKLKRLKKEGVCYSANLNQIIRTHYWIRIGSMVSAYAVCSYHNHAGEIFTAKSYSFILEEHRGEYNVLVYVNPDNVKDYAVELGIY
jgi:transcriptional regulator with XRE-family HTH domain